MSQVITNAFEQYWQSCLAAEKPVVLDEFILADIPNLDITSPIDPETGLPPESQIVHRQNVDQRGRINNNAVAYTIVMDTTVGDFSFNAMYLRNKANGVIGMIVYKGRETKLKTDQTTGQTGNSLVKSMLMGYDQAAEATLTNVDAGTWQIDYAARLRGMDEDIRQLQADLYGHHTFVGDGFKVVEKDGAYQVTQGVAIIGGLRVELKAPEVIHPGTKPIGVWVDAYRAGSLLSEHQNHFTIITSVADLADHVDSNGYQHYVAKLATVKNDGAIEDGRIKNSGVFEKIIEAVDAGDEKTFIKVVDFLSGVDGYGRIGEATYDQIRGYSGGAEKINCIGRSNIFDGARGFFYVDASDRQSDDDDGTILVDMLGRRWKRIFEGEVHVSWWGADSSGVNNSDRSVQKAVDKLKGVGGTVVFDAGEYLLRHIDLVGMEYSGIEIKGGGRSNTKIIFDTSGGRHYVSGWNEPTFSRNNSADGIFYFSSNTSDTSDDRESIKDVAVYDICFVMDVVSNGFDQLMHCICGYGVSGFVVNRCSFYGFMGDGVCVSRGDGALRNAYNSDVDISFNYFDGLNNDNRQAVSIYYCVSYKVNNNVIKNVSRFDMPGAIDIEPDDAVRDSINGEIRNNRITNCTGAVGAITVICRGEKSQRNVLIQHNIIKDCVVPFALINTGANTSSDLLRNFSVKYNVVDGFSGHFIIRGVKGVEVVGNTFT